MREQEIEDVLKEDFLDKHETTSKEATSFAHNAVVDILDCNSIDANYDELEALKEFEDLFESMKKAIDLNDFGVG